MEKELWKGNEAIAEAAIRAGCDCFFGYPITPQSEVPEYMSAHLPKAGGVFLQSESEVAAINMVYGAAGAGMRAMTSSSSPGISLKQEGITYIAGAELPCVIVNCMRGGPGLGTIQPGQGDYYQATRGGGNGDYRTLVLSPSNVQEAVDFVQEAFDIADQYRNPVMVVMDGLIGQMMEPIEWRPVPKRDLPPKDWATTGRKDRDHNNIINSLYMDPEECDRHNDHLAEKYALMEKNEVRWSETECEDAEIDPEAPENQRREQQHDNGGANQAQLLADDGEDEIVVLLRQIEKLLAALPQAHAPQPAGADGDEALAQLVTGSLGIQPGVVPHLDAGGVVADHAQHQIQQQSGCTHSQPHPSPVDAAHQHHHRAGAHDEDGAGEVGLDAHQGCQDNQQHRIGGDAVAERLHTVLFLGDAVGKIDRSSRSRWPRRSRCVPAPPTTG